MKLTELFTADESERAVSPVIGVILMVAITVILAAVIGTFVLGLGDQVQQTSPNAQWNWDNPASDQLDVTHEGGDTVEVNNIDFSHSGGGQGINDAGSWSGGSTEISAGSTYPVVDGGGDIGGTYRLIWTGQGTSSTLSTYEA
jgi:flagellin-like protein